jgi:hypothetical protein
VSPASTGEEGLFLVLPVGSKEVLEIVGARWTTLTPTEPGFYWYRDRFPGGEWCMYIAELSIRGTFELNGIDTPFTGQFWSVRISPPNES